MDVCLKGLMDFAHIQLSGVLSVRSLRSEYEVSCFKSRNLSDRPKIQIGNILKNGSYSLTNNLWRHLPN